MSAPCEGLAVLCLSKQSDSPCLVQFGGKEFHHQVGCAAQSPDRTTLEPKHTDQPEGQAQQGLLSQLTSLSAGARALSSSCMSLHADAGHVSGSGKSLHAYARGILGSGTSLRGHATGDVSGSCTSPHAQARDVSALPLSPTCLLRLYAGSLKAPGLALP